MDNQNSSNPTQPPQAPDPWAPPPPLPVPPAPDISSPWPVPQPPAPEPAPTPTPTWTPPVQEEVPSPMPAPEPVFPEPAPTPIPIPTFTSPSSIPAPATNSPGTDTSNLNNPWGTPTQPPTTEPSWTSTAQAESAPTDLSHLISDSGNTPPAETLVIPSAPAANLEVPDLPAETHKGIPKWVLSLGVVLLLLVIGTSAYFILGIGQPAKTTTSLPAVTQTPAPTIIPTSQPTTAPAASGSANFGDLQGSGSAPQATSAAELLRQRSQGR